ncbi:YezD family protein [Pseudobacillus sp. FSL P4-0506]|uniref:YezD family protein n=1 Tax=unclassified Pseudobacillus TaxID=2619284 RepID=UPI0030F9CDDF
MENIEEEKINYILKMLTNIKYGSLVITIHDGQITQIDSIEKNRFTTNKKLTSKK